MLIGSYDVRFDETGRIVVPSKLRDVLGEVVVGLPAVPDTDHLLLFSEPMFKAFMEQMARRLTLSGDHLDLLRRFSGEAERMKLDKSGRILVPAGMRKDCGLLGEEVKAVGMVRFAELWGAESYADQRKLSRGRAANDEARNLLRDFAMPGLAGEEAAA